VHGYINPLGQRVMPTLDALIAKYKVPSSTIYRTSSKDKWKDQRNAFRDKLREEIDLQKTDHEIFAKIKELLNKETQITPNGLASVSTSALTAQKLIKNTSPSFPSSQSNQSTFLDALKILDEIADLKRSLA